MVAMLLWVDHTTKIVITKKGQRVEDRSESSQSKNVGGQSLVGEHITVLINLLLLFIMIISCCYYYFL